MIENTEQLKDFITKCLEDKQADNVVVLDISEKTNLAKYMIFASGRSTKNVASIAEYIGLELKHNSSLETIIEGSGQAEWVLLDAGEVILHIFYPETRAHLKLEEMWEKRKTN